jgi:hypothetical protein
MRTASALRDLIDCSVLSQQETSEQAIDEGTRINARAAPEGKLSNVRIGPSGGEKWLGKLDPPPSCWCVNSFRRNTIDSCMLGRTP